MKQKTNTFSKAIKLISLMLVSVIILLSLTACKEGSFAGEYSGTAGTYIKLNKDGTCIYAEDDSTGAGRGTWYIEDDMIYIEVDILNYTLYGSVEDANDGFILLADAYTWNEEYFSKTK